MTIAPIKHSSPQILDTIEGGSYDPKTGDARMISDTRNPCASNLPRLVNSVLSPPPGLADTPLTNDSLPHRAHQNQGMTERFIRDAKPIATPDQRNPCQRFRFWFRVGFRRRVGIRVLQLRFGRVQGTQGHHLLFLRQDLA